MYTPTFARSEVYCPESKSGAIKPAYLRLLTPSIVLGQRSAELVQANPTSRSRRRCCRFACAQSGHGFLHCRPTCAHSSSARTAPLRNSSIRTPHRGWSSLALAPDNLNKLVALGTLSLHVIARLFVINTVHLY